MDSLEFLVPGSLGSEALPDSSQGSPRASALATVFGASGDGTRWRGAGSSGFRWLGWRSGFWLGWLGSGLGWLGAWLA